MSEVLIYYSLNGNTEKYAKKYAEKTGADIFRVEEPKKQNTLTAFFSCPKGIKGKSVPINPLDVDFGSYDHIVLAAPIWASAPAPAINSVVELLPKGKDVGIILMSSSGESKSDSLKSRIEASGCKVVGVENIKMKDNKK
jgi:flavodoxin